MTSSITYFLAGIIIGMAVITVYILIGIRYGRIIINKIKKNP